ncbi:3-beta hydroxysteroid dehydrogenase [Paenibacillus chitinolyticus]|uniref:3-beta hydroxysteroid dehydrogenase n=1 Tax=Paenibacillus chitinolyticus TaxID=79263 RepID=A0A410X3R4_9BACL|nr:SDR family oxidoreductase [Paenibacillus chitinolyticus]MCY9593462.1 SDR family oxidoreductase [Paenibacillus chitinolyticus]MCY9596201.1 SDR family oxidoreductase [Paenibacillus chitinolyticus]QAV21278.1 3-beta hydroxysteroid dehydrogenase [Paenibacillus chitinolyticus]
MNVFVTGATGWIGSVTVDELLKAGHKVVGLVRSDVSAASLEAKGAKVLRGDLDDLDSLRRGASDAEAVIHLANKHDFANPAESDRAERAAVETLAEALVGTNRPFMVATGLSGLYQGRPILETDPSPDVSPDSHRGGAENLALDYVDRGVRTMIIRFAPTVHGAGDWGFVKFLVSAARKHGVSGYIDDGSHAWSAVHRSDAAKLIRLGIEKAPAGARLHAVAEETISTRAIAEAIGRALDIPVVTIAPEDAVAHFGFVGSFFKLSMNGSSERTRELLEWAPAGPTLIDDILAGAYKEAGK